MIYMNNYTHKKLWDVLLILVETPMVVWLIIVHTTDWMQYFDSLVKDCSDFIAKAPGLLQSCTKPSI